MKSIKVLMEDEEGTTEWVMEKSQKDEELEVSEQFWKYIGGKKNEMIAKVNIGSDEKPLEFIRTQEGRILGVTIGNRDYSEVVIDLDNPHSPRILFFRPLDGRPGCKLRLEISLNMYSSFSKTAYLRRNMTPWDFDSWELEKLFSIQV